MSRSRSKLQTSLIAPDLAMGSRVEDVDSGRTGVTEGNCFSRIGFWWVRWDDDRRVEMVRPEYLRLRIEV